MIEETVLNYLTEIMGVPVYMEEPETKPDSYLVLEKTGSGLENYIWNATISVQSHATTLYDAAELNNKVITAMQSLTTDSNVCRVDLNSDYNFTDSTTKRYRYQAIFDIVHY